MAIEEKMKEVLEKHSGPDSPEFLRLRDFYEEKKKEGVVRKQEYTIPPPRHGWVIFTQDTIRRTTNNE